MGLEEPVRGIEGAWGKIPIALLQTATLNEIRVYGALASFQGHNDHCWPSLIEIGTRAALHPDNVSKAIQKLKRSGWVTVKRRGMGMTNCYIALVEIEMTDSAETAESDSVKTTDTDWAETTESDSVKTTESLLENNKGENNKGENNKGENAPLLLTQEEDEKGNCKTIISAYLEHYPGNRKPKKTNGAETKFANLLLKERGDVPDIVANLQILAERASGPEARFYVYSLEWLYRKWAKIDVQRATAQKSEGVWRAKDRFLSPEEIAAEEAENPSTPSDYKDPWDL